MQLCQILLQTQVRLSSVGCVRLVDRRGYLTVVLPRFVSLPNPQSYQNCFPPVKVGSHLISQGGTGQSTTASARGCARVAHSNPGIFKTVLGASFGRLTLFQVGCKEAKGRLMQSAEQFWAGRETDQVGMKTVVTSFSSFPQMEEWLLARARVGEKYQYTGAREEPRPSSAASVDRRRQRRRAASECKPTLSKFPSSSPIFSSDSEAGTSLPRVGRRSASADRARRSSNTESQFSKQQQQGEQGNGGSEDSGVSSLNNSTAGSRTSGRPGRPQYRT